MATSRIPDDFLRGPSQGATVHCIDFTKASRTTPAIPAFKDHFAAVIDNFMTETECTELLNIAENSTIADQTNAPVWEHAMINIGGGKQAMSVDSRKSGRIILDSPDIAQRILDRLRPFMRDFNLDKIKNQPLITGLGPARRGETFHLSTLNERLRFLRYEGGDYFRPHWDGCYVTPDGKEKSLLTIQLYLNGDGEQDLNKLLPEIERAEKRNALFVQDGEVDLCVAGEQSDSPADLLSQKLLGGATSFTDDYRAQKVVRVFPKTGSLLIFQQRNLMHSGDDVFRGVNTLFGLMSWMNPNLTALEQNEVGTRTLVINFISSSSVHNTIMIANNIAYTAPINPAGETPLSHAQVWAGLILKIRSAESFVSGAISKTEVLSESVDPSTGNTVIVRDVVFRESGKKVQETVTAFEPTRVEFEQAGGNISNVISEGGNGELYLTYVFEWKHPEASKEEMAEFLVKEKNMGKTAVEGTLKVLRQMVTDGKL